jgi:septum site-determining protein MinC
MGADTIVLKGTRDGLQITLGEGDLEGLFGELAQRLAEKGGFFEGARVIIQAGARYLTLSDLTALQALLARCNMTLWAVLSESEDTRATARQLGLATRLGGARPVEPEPAGPAGMPAFLRGGRESTAQPAAPAAAAAEVTTNVPSVEAVEDGIAGVFVRRTLRSGKSLRYAGAVFVLGDVNPGAEIIAGGDVIVWGKLRGMVHAGAMGDEQAVVCALEMAPTQLRIAGRIAIAPEDRRKRRPSMPELARIRDGQIVAESWKM